MRKLLTRAKFQGDLLALPALHQIVEKTLARDSIGTFDLVTHIPSHSAHVKKRGLSLPALLVHHLSRKKQIPWDRHLLKWVRSVPAQTSLSREARLANVEKALVANQDVSNQRVLVIDDVSTTGATGSEATRALLEQGANQVLFIACARTPLAALDAR